MAFSLLTDPLFRYSTGRELVTASLPDVYEALIADKVDAFPALRPHQRHAWHAFLSQLGAFAMYRAEVRTPPESAQEWAGLLHALTADYPAGEPWHLVVEDITRPAFMQPPARSAELEKDYKSTVTAPDELDVLITSKNHDVKKAVGVLAAADDWVFALITLQTMEGYTGAGNFGISRMNSGSGSRPAFSLAPSEGRIGAHVRRDIRSILELRESLLTAYGMANDGHSLLWLLPWNGTSPEVLNFDALDPLYIDVCRRVRLCQSADGRIHGVRATSRAARINIKDLKGRTGDPWTPFNSRRGGVPLTLGPGGFTYRRMAECLITSPDWEQPALLRQSRHDEGQVHLIARAMVRGQGKTEGYHERTIPVRGKLRSAMQRRGGTVEVGTIASERIEQVGTVQRILSHAIQVFSTGGDEDLTRPEHRTRARPWLNRLDAMVDARFFEALQDEFEAEEARRQYIRDRWLMNGVDGVVDHARALLHDAEYTLPCPAIHAYRARSIAESLFEGRLRGNGGLPFLFDKKDAETED